MTILLLSVSLLLLVSVAADIIVQIGSRPFYLVDEMKEGPLKDKLAQCAAETKVYKVSDFSIGHRGAALMYPEHTIESYKAALIQGAGIVECDVTFTKDRELICRHDQCDLHTTTDVILRPKLNAKCTVPWAKEGVEPKCCTTDFTLAEIKKLCAKMDSSNESAKSKKAYVYGGTPDWRTDLYASYGATCPKVPTHKESIELIGNSNGKFTPELKSPQVAMPYEGNYTQQEYAQQMINEYIDAGIPPCRVWPQSFSVDDVYYWLDNTDYGQQAVALDEIDDRDPNQIDEFLDELVEKGVQIVAPPLFRLVEAGKNEDIVPSYYAMAAKDRGLDIITWTLERTPPGLMGYYWQSLNEANFTTTEGSRLELLHVLNEEVGVLGVFSDWPATTTFYANCMNVKTRAGLGPCQD
jgi:glycerophosphoryl diester phosphodiesterase